MLNLIKEHNNKQKFNFWFKEKVDLKQSKLDFEKLLGEEKIVALKMLKALMILDTKDTKENK